MIIEDNYPMEFLSKNSYNAELSNEPSAYNQINLKSFNSSLYNTISVLQNSIKDNEADFINLGNKLNYFLKRSREISDKAGNTTNALSEDVLKKGIFELSDLLFQSSEYLSESSLLISRDKQDLLNIVSKIYIIIDNLDGFRKIVKRLRMLGVSTKIESSRLGTDDHGFTTIADQVESLSSLIHDKASAIQIKSNFMITEITNATRFFDILYNEQNNQLNIISTSAKSSLSTFEEKLNETNQKKINILDDSKRIENNIKEIVFSVQFHDITRQQIEHVIESIHEYLNNGNNFADSEDELEASASTLLDLSELESMQLGNSIREFESAVVDIITQLKSAENSIGDIGNAINGVLNDESGCKSECLKKVQKELDLIFNGLNKNTQLGLELSNSIKNLVEILDSLGTYVLEIEDIGTEIEIIALNARVRAAHTGAQGAGLGVLSEAIQNLSIEAKNITSSTSEIIKSICVDSKNLKESIESETHSDSSHILNHTKIQIGDFTEKINNSLSQADGAISVLNNDVNNFDAELHGTVNSINIHHRMKESINSCINELNTIAYQLRNSGVISRNKTGNTNGLVKKYTMHSERIIHNNFTQNKHVTNNNTIHSYKADNSLGDNVELF